MPDELVLRLSNLPGDKSWRVVQWLVDRGADEFTLACISGRSEDAFFCRQADQALSSYVVAGDPGSDRLTRGHAWRLDERSLRVLKTLLPEGVLTDRQGTKGGWLEDLTIYQEGRPRLASVTHEHYARLTLRPNEYQELRELGLVD